MGEDTNIKLDTTRQISSVPSVHGAWAYPSEAQFNTIVQRKGHRVSESDIPVVVAIHNSVNEETWRQIMVYEKLHKNSCANPKLIRFVGRPTERSPKSQLFEALGFTTPFDRHDWIIDRCGTTIRYIIDFYDGSGLSTKPIAICIDARPDVTSHWQNIFDRARIWWDRTILSTLQGWRTNLTREQ